ncbi:MAG: DUF1223 domain-containing protein [Hyphomonadaceae bacterium]|nr:DUF1223 domain-containing protein [Hyphomonadaceae bacterium]
MALRRLMLLALTALALVGAPAAAQPQASVVVELYTSQGCASCGRANGLLGDLARQPDVVALTFPVDYWDYLGWRDTFAQSQFTARQRAYLRSLRSRALYTPQVIVNGAYNANAARPQRVREAMAAARAAQPIAAPAITLTQTDEDTAALRIGRGPAPRAPADVWVATYLPGPVNVLVTAGENAGHRVGHYNIVRRLVRVGAWNGDAIAFDAVPCRPECAALVQAPNGGPVYAAARVRQP